MKSLEDKKKLRDDLKAAYESILAHPDTDYSNSTIVYARKCYEDAENAVKWEQFNEFIKEETDSETE